jgi:hypothetical protein
VHIYLKVAAAEQTGLVDVTFHPPQDGPDAGN